MKISYKDKFYNHFENQEYRASLTNQDQFKRQNIEEENLLLRYKVRIPSFNFHRNNLTIRYFKKGEGQLVLKDKVLKVQNDQFLVLNPNEGWQYLNDKNEYIDVLSFSVSDDLLGKHNFYVNEKTDKILDNPWGGAQTNYIFLESLLNANHYRSGQLLQYLYSLSHQVDFKYTCPEELTIEVLQALHQDQRLGHRIVQKIQAKKTSTRIETLKRLLSAYEFIHDNTHVPISLEELSHVSSLSKFHLYDSFKKAFGKTPHQYINRLKMAKAKALLQNKDIPVGEVAEAYGFSDLSVFSKAFKKIYGHAPSHF